MNKHEGLAARAARFCRAFRPRRFARRRRGSQLVEVAITLPIIIILLGATAEFACFFYSYTTLTNAVRSGARHASKWEIGSSWTIPETQRMVVYGDYSDTSKGPILPGLSTSNVTITANGPSPHAIQSVTVAVTGYKYVPLFDLGKLTGVKSLSLNINMNASATMKQLFNGPIMTDLRAAPAGEGGQYVAQR
ncbi:MAG TPA: TadE/TadG family type IV pilus assembly protein [Pyrinomonadaceae bacterium]|jgi:Flp pilus assembly protein TadG|nr:TadE/TadG family type IV pilus assembly protein [Pyrinomonadaceae bacterium]